MIQRTVNLEPIDDKIAYYSNLPIDELKKIQPFWAWGEFSKFIMNDSIRPTSNEFIITEINIAALIKKSDFFEVNSDVLFTGENLNDRRVVQILHRWIHRQYIDPPSIYMQDSRPQKIVFSDGRHRTKVAYLLGFETMPVAIYQSDFTAILNRLEL